ncbi:extracellular matrix regulator RemB [Alkaliphilus transvaalensis]|uniref:extracellular matrix regulator RemB n=1 Tax=Alkaliphilus transvaalensis TaxID=114628 RepID=UPI0004795E30|nr:extracellular matrix/biofilm biosynthesis regulator RemA family protein [Alkaliphilus transvaalensis]
MFLHLGGEVVVPLKEVIAIFDMQSTTKSKHSQYFLQICKEEGFVEEILQEEARSFVITERLEKSSKNGKKTRKTIIYYSPISALTLQKRAGFIDDIDKF